MAEKYGQKVKRTKEQRFSLLSLFQKIKDYIDLVKTIVLTLLVLSSIILTWVVWSYQPLDEFVPSNIKYIQEVKIGEKKELVDIIYPYEMVSNKEAKLHGTQDRLAIRAAFKDFTQFELSKFKEINIEARFYEDRKAETFSEFLFPTSVPANVMSKLFSVNDKDFELAGFNRIVISIDNQDKTNVYFISSQKNKALKAILSEGDMSSFMKAHFLNSPSLKPYFVIKESDKRLYMPKGITELENLTFSIEYLAPSKFKDTLFMDPSLVKQYQFKDVVESYTDGARVLEVFHLQHQIRFINPGHSDIIKMNSSEILNESFSFINSHAGWTDSFSLFDINSEKQTINYRLIANKYPILDMDNLYSIFQSWRDNEISEYQRSLMNLLISIENSKTTKLPSGQVVFDYLKRSKQQFDASLIENIMIGYEPKKDAPSTYFIELEPYWFVKYDGNWEKLTLPSGIQNQGGSGVGLEQNKNNIHYSLSYP